MTAQPHIHRGICKTTLARCQGGVSMIEFALVLPIFITIALTGLELFNYLLCTWRVNEIALEAADNASRVGLNSSLQTQTLREVDIDDVLTAAALQGRNIDLINNGRVTISSLEDPQTGSPKGQYIHWQRCIGMKTGANYDSTNGVAGDGASPKPAINGMGHSNPQVKAPPNMGVMFVEVNYQYQPLVLDSFISTAQRRMHYEQAFIIRDNRTLADQSPSNPTPTNPDPKAVVHDCNLPWSA